MRALKLVHSDEHSDIFEWEEPAFIELHDEDVCCDEPAAEARPSVSLRYAGELDCGFYTVFASDVMIAGDAVERGTSSIQPVPPGEVEVHWIHSAEDTAVVRRLKLAVGEERELVWDGKP